MLDGGGGLTAARIPMIEKIRIALRITTTDFDEQLRSYIDAALEELKKLGVNKPDEEDPLICMCCELYCKYLLNYEGKGDWYYARYRALRDNMSTMQSYVGEEKNA